MKKAGFTGFLYSRLCVWIEHFLQMLLLCCTIILVHKMKNVHTTLVHYPGSYGQVHANSNVMHANSYDDEL